MQTHPLLRPGPAAVSAAALAICGTTGAVTISGSTSDYVELDALARVLTVAAPIAVGLYALSLPPFARFGRLLILAGVGWFLASLSNSDQAIVYSIGRVFGWAVEVMLIYLLLAFPTGRLESRVDRALVRAGLLLLLILYLPTALLVENYPVPVQWTSCEGGCPDNAFMVTGSEPGFIEDLVRPLREILTIALFVAIALRLAARIRDASHLTRLTLAPVLAVASFRCAAFGGILLGRRVAPESEVVDVSVWLLAIAVPLTAAAFLIGLGRWWLFIAGSTQRLAARLHGHPSPEELRTALAEAFEDPSLEIVYWLDDGEGSWAGADGHRVERPLVASGRDLTEVRDGTERVAGIIHDAALRDDRAFIDTATSYAVMTLDNHRLSAQTSSLLREVRESRARIQAAADEERRRIERDLHDGAQQRLVALRIKLELAAERTGGGEGERAVALRGLGGDVEEALDEIRSLARGIYPSPLADRGLVEGLRAAALRNALPTTVLAAGVQRYSREVESAAYFCCLEALQNAAKHAQDASAAVIDLYDNGALRVEIRDDGAGFDPHAVAGGLGFTSMRDRVAAVGGEIDITSSPGRGTCVTASIPLGREGR
jgi:signal transduction histidine kinase